MPNRLLLSAYIPNLLLYIMKLLILPLDADAYEYVREKGIFNPEAARKFRDLLQKGASVPPMELYRQFRGRDPKPQAMLRRAGLIP